jgi:hypothetical protein
MSAGKEHFTEIVVCDPNDSAMKRSSWLVLFSLLLLPLLLKSQSIEGTWYMEDPTTPGTTELHKVSFLSNGSLHIDYGNNGTLDVRAIYKIKGSQFAVFDIPEDSPCYGQTGIYEFTIKENTATITLLTDPCESRRKEKQILRRAK